MELLPLLGYAFALGSPRRVGDNNFKVSFEDATPQH